MSSSIRGVGLGVSVSALVIAAAVACGTTSRGTTSSSVGADAAFNTADPTGPCMPNAANFEVPGNACDDDGDGTIDNVVACDQSLVVTGGPEDFARALGICKKADHDGWGLVSAVYTNSFGSTGEPASEQHGILPHFGMALKPREGAALGVLSSGWAREFNGPGAEIFMKGQLLTGPGKIPPGFPKPAAGCDIAQQAFDVSAVVLKIKTPANAKGIAIDFNFFSSEWPAYVCSQYNDGFVAMLQSTAYGGGLLGNISFDAQNNPVSVNNAFFDRCTPNTHTGCGSFPPKDKIAECPGGESELEQTGYAARDIYCPGPGAKPSTAGGATGWLTSKAPVAPGETITLELFIWDTGDGKLDSSVLLDNLRWEVAETTTVTERPK